MENMYHPKKLTEELQTAGLPVAGVSSSGRIDYSRELTKTEKSAAETVVAAHDPCKTDEEIEQELITSKGISDHDLLMALWKKVVEADSTAADTLVIEIEQV